MDGKRTGFSSLSSCTGVHCEPSLTLVLQGQTALATEERGSWEATSPSEIAGMKKHLSEGHPCRQMILCRTQHSTSALGEQKHHHHHSEPKDGGSERDAAAKMNPPVHGLSPHARGPTEISLASHHLPSQAPLRLGNGMLGVGFQKQQAK